MNEDQKSNGGRSLAENGADPEVVLGLELIRRFQHLSLHDKLKVIKFVDELASAQQSD
jgi:hypothetical protein